MRYNKEEVIEIARGHKIICVLFVVLFLQFGLGAWVSREVFMHRQTIVMSALAEILSISMIILIFFFAFQSYCLARSLKLAFPILYAIAALVPWVQFISLFVIVNKATKLLKKRGIRVGTLGYVKKSFQKYKFEEGGDQA